MNFYFILFHYIFFNNFIITGRKRGELLRRVVLVYSLYVNCNTGLHLLQNPAVSKVCLEYLYFQQEIYILDLVPKNTVTHIIRNAFNLTHVQLNASVNSGVTKWEVVMSLVDFGTLFSINSVRQMKVTLNRLLGKDSR